MQYLETPRASNSPCRSAKFHPAHQVQFVRNTYRRTNPSSPCLRQDFWADKLAPNTLPLMFDIGTCSLRSLTKKFRRAGPRAQTEEKGENQRRLRCFVGQHG